MHLEVFLFFYTGFCVIFYNHRDILVFWYYFIIFKFKKLHWTHIYLGLINKQNPNYLSSNPSLNFFLYLKNNNINPLQKDQLYLFGSVVAVAFQITFRAKMHQNDFFYFLKIIFDISTSKWFENTKNILIWSK